MIDKIKKLLRLANCKAASPAEAAQALKRALKMAEESGLNLDQIDPDEDSGDSGVGHSTSQHNGIGIAEKLSMHLVCRHFHVDHIMIRSRYVKPSINFIGGKVAVQLALYAHEYLVKSMRNAWQEQSDRRLKREAFMHGFIWAIQEQMPEVFRDEALVLVFDHYIESTFLTPGMEVKTTQTKSLKPGADASFFKGFQKGNKAGIRNGLEGSETPQLPA